MRQDAKPIHYRDCYLAEVFPPRNGVKTQVERIGDSLLAETPCMVIEFRDTQAGLQEGIQRGLPEDSSCIESLMEMLDIHPELGLERGFMTLREARALCCNLVTFLADTNDRVARRMQEVMHDTIEELREADPEDWDVKYNE